MTDKKYGIHFLEKFSNDVKSDKGTNENKENKENKDDSDLYFFDIFNLHSCKEDNHYFNWISIPTKNHTNKYYNTNSLYEYIEHKKNNVSDPNKNINNMEIFIPRLLIYRELQDNDITKKLLLSDVTVEYRRRVWLDTIDKFRERKYISSDLYHKRILVDISILYSCKHVLNNNDTKDDDNIITKHYKITDEMNKNGAFFIRESSKNPVIENKNGCVFTLVRVNDKCVRKRERWVCIYGVGLYSMGNHDIMEDLTNRWSNMTIDEFNELLIRSGISIKPIFACIIDLLVYYQKNGGLKLYKMILKK